MRRVVVAVVIISLVCLPAALAATFPQWTACHGEAQITQTETGIACVFAEDHLYQRVTYYTSTYTGAYVARFDLMELRHKGLGNQSAVKAGLRDPDSLRHFYRIEYQNHWKRTNEDGIERVSFVTVYSGPEGVLIEIFTLIPVAVGPTVEGDKPTVEANL